MQPRLHSTLASTELSALAVPSCIPAATNTVRNVVVGGVSAILSRFPKPNQTPMLLLLKEHNFSQMIAKVNVRNYMSSETLDRLIFPLCLDLWNDPPKEQPCSSSYLRQSTKIFHH